MFYPRTLSASLFATLLAVTAGFSVEPPMMISLTAQDWPTYKVTWRNSDPAVDSIAVYHGKTPVLASKVASPGADGAYTENFQSFTDSACYAVQAFVGSTSSAIGATKCIAATPAPTYAPMIALVEKYHGLEIREYTAFELQDTINLNYTTGFPKSDSASIQYVCSDAGGRISVPVTSGTTDTLQTHIGSSSLVGCENEPVKIWVNAWKAGLPVYTSKLDVLPYDRNALEKRLMNHGTLGSKYSTILSGGSNEGTYLFGDTLFAKEGLPNGISMYLISDLRHPQFLGVRYSPLYSIKFSAVRDTIVTNFEICTYLPRTYCKGSVNFVTPTLYGFDTLAKSELSSEYFYEADPSYQMVNGHSVVIWYSNGFTCSWRQFTRSGSEVVYSEANINYIQAAQWIATPLTIADPWIFVRLMERDYNQPSDPITYMAPIINSVVYIFPNGFGGGRYLGKRKIELPQGKVVGGFYFTDAAVTTSGSAQLLGDSAISLTYSGHTDFYPINTPKVGIHTKPIPSRTDVIATILSYDGKVLESNVQNIPAALSRLNSGKLQVVIVTSPQGSKRYLVGQSKR